MRKKTISLLAIASGCILFLSGCSNTKIETSKQEYQVDGMTAVVKGKTDSNNTLTYQIDGGKKHQLQIKNREFVFQVPGKDKNQKVKLTAKHGSQTTTKVVTVKKQEPLSKNYQEVCEKFEQTISMSQLSQSELEVLQKAKNIDTQNQSEVIKNQDVLRQAKEIQTKIAKSGSNSISLKKNASGITNLIKNQTFTLRANIQSNQLISATIIVPTSNLKNKDKTKQFGTAFVAFSQAIGANGKEVMEEFEKETKSQNNSQTTSKTIKNHGVTYSVGFSKTDLYIYITK